MDSGGRGPFIPSSNKEKAYQEQKVEKWKKKAKRRQRRTKFKMRMIREANLKMISFSNKIPYSVE